MGIGQKARKFFGWVVGLFKRGCNREDEFVTLYRSVDKEELNDVLRIGGFRPKIGTDGFPRSMSAKEFSTSLDNAGDFSRDLFKLEGTQAVPKFILQTKVPRKTFQQLEKMLLDGKPSVIVQPEQLSFFNKTITKPKPLNFTPLPRERE